MTKLSDMPVKNAPAPLVSEAFQKGLKAVGGLNPYGEPRLRLVWGQSEMRVAFGELRMKYLAAVATVRHIEKDLATGLYQTVERRVDIGKPRWMIEEWWPPTLLDKPNWDEAILGPFPERGQYRHLLTLETEDAQYRHPDDECLQWVKRLIRMNEADKLMDDPNGPMPEHQREAEIKRMADEERAEKAAKQKKIKERVKSALAPHVKRMMTPNPNEGRGY